MIIKPQHSQIFAYWNVIFQQPTLNHGHDPSSRIKMTFKRGAKSMASDGGDAGQMPSGNNAALQVDGRRKI